LLSRFEKGARLAKTLGLTIGGRGRKRKKSVGT